MNDAHPGRLNRVLGAVVKLVEVHLDASFLQSLGEDVCRTDHKVVGDAVGDGRPQSQVVCVPQQPQIFPVDFAEGRLGKAVQERPVAGGKQFRLGHHPVTLPLEEPRTRSGAVKNKTKQR